ncbi:Hypothetical predicted protein [Paramuricea clavata]|uniref:Uncharacterized protein n=1 Tax=Paramuricea clavata TaxID=317549 RepID=A0A7D9DW41_PARCT|nr:Hypothetical predicted protein [Paramuricea clavata]
MRDSGFIKLPSERTLRDYTHWTKVSSGFQPSSFERLLVDIRYHQLADWQKYVVLLHDEVKIKSDLVFCKHTGELIGFANLGEINNALIDFQKQLEDECTNGKPDIASYTCLFSCSESLGDYWFKGDRQYTCDGESSNRKFIKMHKPYKSAKEIEIHKTRNIYSPEERDLFFISDVPHLIKTVRNNWENSGWNKKTRELWDEINLAAQVYIAFVDNFIAYFKDTFTIVSIISSFCSEVLSTSVANARQSFYDQKLQGTVEFIKMFDKFFDCMNTRSLTEASRNRKPDLAPYTSPDDSRLKVFA